MGVLAPKQLFSEWGVKWRESLLQLFSSLPKVEFELPLRVPVILL